MLLVYTKTKITRKFDPVTEVLTSEVVLSQMSKVFKKQYSDPVTVYPKINAELIFI